jgi:hypothetical protein
MPVQSIDLDDGLTALLAAELSALNTDIASPATPNPITWGEDVRAAAQALISRVQGGMIYEPDFSGLATNALTNGTESIDGINWTVANAASLGTFSITNGSGLVMSAGNSLGSATTFTSASQAAPHLYVPLSSIPGFSPMYDYAIEIYCTNLVHESSGEGVFVGLWGPAASPYAVSAARVRWAGLYNGGTNRNIRTTSQATATTGDVTITTHNVVGLMLNGDGTGRSYSGVWSSGWPTSWTMGPIFPTGAGAADPIWSGLNRIVIGLSVANDASATTTATIQRMRIRRF